MGELTGWGGVLLAVAANVSVFVHMIRQVRVDDIVVLERVRMDRLILLARSVPAGIVVQAMHSDGSFVVVDAHGLTWHEQGRKPQRG